MTIDNKLETGYFDKFHKEIMVGDLLLFDNGSKYVVMEEESNVLLKSLSNLYMPPILLSKITFGTELCSASITTSEDPLQSCHSNQIPNIGCKNCKKLV